MCVRGMGWLIHTLTLPQHIHTQVALAAVQKSVAVDGFMVVVMSHHSGSRPSCLGQAKLACNTNCSI